MKQNYLLVIGAAMMLSIGLISSCSTSDSISGSIALSDVSHSECTHRYMSRTDSDDEEPFGYTPKLRLTYNEADETISGEYIQYLPGCDYTDAGINIEQEADGTLMLNPWNDSKGLVNCVCPINLYFTIRNATIKNYHLVLDRRIVTLIDPDGSKHQEVWTDYDGYISFKNQNVIIIDL